MRELQRSGDESDRHQAHRCPTQIREPGQQDETPYESGDPRSELSRGQDAGAEHGPHDQSLTPGKNPDACTADQQDEREDTVLSGGDRGTECRGPACAETPTGCVPHSLFNTAAIRDEQRISPLVALSIVLSSSPLPPQLPDLPRELPALLGAQRLPHPFRERVQLPLRLGKLLTNTLGVPWVGEVLAVASGRLKASPEGAPLPPTAVPTAQHLRSTTAEPSPDKASN